MINRFLVAQMRCQKKSDWIYQVMSDLKKLDLNENIELLKLMRKSQLKMKLDKMIKENAFKELSMKKESHSKVRNVKHEKIEMQAYLKANESKITQLEAREIFKLRCRVTDVKANFKGKFDNIECELCNEHEEENQKHIMHCKTLNKTENKIILKFDEILKSNVKNQLQIVRRFIENMKIRKQILEV